MVPVAYPAQHPNATAEGRVLETNFDPKRDAVAALPQPHAAQNGVDIGNTQSLQPHVMPSESEPKSLAPDSDQPATFRDRLQQPKPRSAAHYKPRTREPGALELKLGVPRVALLFLSRTYATPVVVR